MSRLLPKDSLSGFFEDLNITNFIVGDIYVGFGPPNEERRKNYGYTWGHVPLCALDAIVKENGFLDLQVGGGKSAGFFGYNAGPVPTMRVAHPVYEKSTEIGKHVEYTFHSARYDKEKNKIFIKVVIWEKVAVRSFLGHIFRKEERATIGKVTDESGEYTIPQLRALMNLSPIDKVTNHARRG